MNNKSVINLNPIFFNKEEEYRPKLNSIFLYIFLFFQFLVIICILYFFFKIEILFLYTNLISKEQYNEEDKRKYNYYMYGLKNIITMNKYCESLDNKWYPKFGKGKNMLTLDQHNIVFNTEVACKEFLNI